MISRDLLVILNDRLINKANEIMDSQRNLIQKFPLTGVATDGPLDVGTLGVGIPTHNEDYVSMYIYARETDACLSGEASIFWHSKGNFTVMLHLCLDVNDIACFILYNTTLFYCSETDYIGQVCAHRPKSLLNQVSTTEFWFSISKIMHVIFFPLASIS